MIKSFAYALAGLAFMSSVAEARYVGPLLVKEASTGFVIREYAKSQKCEVYADKIVLTTTFGGAGPITSVETKNQTLSGDTINVLKQASKAKLVSQTGAVDGPTVKYTGFLINPNDSVTKVMIYDENGGSGQIMTNPSSEALVLKNILNDLCPNTLQGIGPAPVE